jgi:hypothetical protein
MYSQIYIKRSTLKRGSIHKKFSMALQEQGDLLNTKNPTTYDVGNPGPGLGQAPNGGMVKLMGSKPSLLDTYGQWV